MNKPKKYNIVDTYFYDYHSLQISIETSKIILKSLEMELDCEKESNNHGSVYLLNKKIISRKNLIDNLTEQLNTMEKIIDKFPNQLRGAEYNIFKESVLYNKSAHDVASELGYSEQYVYKIRSRILTNFKYYLEATR